MSQPRKRKTKPVWTASMMGRKGGAQRSKAMTPEQLSAIGQHGLNGIETLFKELYNVSDRM